MTDSIKGYCSYCGEHSTHREQQWSLLRRNVYTCDCCGRRTVQCRICDDFAKGGEFWDDELCAVHDKTITGFQKPNPIDAFKTNAQRQNSKLFEWGEISLKQLLQGTASPIIVIDGFLSENDTNEQDWKDQLAKTHPNHPVFYVYWKSQEAQELYSFFPKQLIGDMIINPKLGLVFGGLSIGKGYSLWAKAKINAESAGMHLANLIKHQSEAQPFILMAHSLGARVIYHALGQLHRLQQSNKIQEVHLLGGALGLEHSWTNAAQSVKGKIHNYYSEQDDTLKYLYNVIELTGGKAIGRNEISGKNIKNHDVTSKVGEHKGYIASLVSITYASKCDAGV
jgi:hypothetical protein